MVKTNNLVVSFIHPDLGIGGAERLVVDAAVGLQQLGHKVIIYTSHHDPKHCFEETADGTLDVRVYGDWLPRHIGGKFMILFALLRNLYLALSLMILSIRYPAPTDTQVALLDQISLSVPILRLVFPRVVFYCHFPDRLLTTRKSWVKRLYRKPFDAVEEFTTGLADETMVNSNFTKEVFKAEFKTIKRLPIVLHPGIQTKSDEVKSFLPSKSLKPLDKVLLSLNRYERKKDVALAVKTFANVVKNGGKGYLKLFVAGGYDTLMRISRLSHNTIAPFPLPMKNDKSSLGSISLEQAQVIFLLSVSNSDRSFLLSNAVCLLYTPSGEHFGIVPVEAMYLRTPVVAVNDGGPTETVLDGDTGYLREPKAEAFSEAVERILGMSEAQRKRMGEAGRRRVEENFTLDSFSRRLDGILQHVPLRRRRMVKAIRGMGAYVPAMLFLVIAIATGGMYLSLSSP
ncbi:hypothetical protein BC829DRAFT_380095 [Chytridium lagenaria]|nr:hypothetical protein BC829DRAFT_380095 [Chytridium lagenaria]